MQERGFECCRRSASHRLCALQSKRSDQIRIFLRCQLNTASAGVGSGGGVRPRPVLNCLLPGGRDGQGPRKKPFSTCAAGAGRGGDLRIDRGWGTEGHTAAAGAPPADNAWDWFAAWMVQAWLHLHFVARSHRIRVFRYALAPEQLQHTDYRPLRNFNRPLTRHHKSSRKRYALLIRLNGTLAHFGAPAPAIHSRSAPRREVLVTFPILPFLIEKGDAGALDRMI